MKVIIKNRKKSSRKEKHQKKRTFFSFYNCVNLFFSEYKPPLFQRLQQKLKQLQYQEI